MGLCYLRYSPYCWCPGCFAMRCVWFLMILFFLAGTALAQEICDNGVDDSGNGLVDLNDPACACDGIFIRQDVTSWIPNPSFENFSCCPTYYNDFGCATGWQNGTNGSPDLHHECGFVANAIVTAGLLPFPDGSGVGGIIFSSTWKEYMYVCLAQPLQPGSTYTLQFHIASLPITGAGLECNNGIVYYSPIEVAIYGKSDCGGIPLPTLECPSAVDPSWVVVGSEIYAPASSWSEMEITITPGVPISSIMIGSPCNVPPSYAGGQPCFPYFLFDGFTLEESAPAPPITIEVSGHPCQGNLTLTASAPVSGGEWQWYFEGVAIPGQTTSSLEIPESNYQPGVYAVRYTLGEDCDIAEVVLSWVLPEPTIEDVNFCPGDTVLCAGQEFWAEGYYEVTLDSWLGCDSVVGCVVLYYPVAVPDTLVIRQCGVDTLLTCHGDTLTQSGTYLFTCEDVFGCRSEQVVDVAFLMPSAVIMTDADLGCDTTTTVMLDGSASSRNSHPLGTTRWEWSGPPGGIAGSPYDSVVYVSLAGTYCLTITHEVDSFACQDMTCVTLQQVSELPQAPDFSPSPPACTSDSLVVVFHIPEGDSLSVFYWYAESGLQVFPANDSTIFVKSDSAGEFNFCGYLENSCGISDTVCRTLTYFSSHEIFLSEVVCDSSAAVTDTIYLQNQAGCDSVVITERIYSESYEEVQYLVHCESGNPYADTLIIPTGVCDSIFIVQHYFVTPDTLFLTGSTCDPLAAGEVVEVHLVMQGCDSVVVTSNLLLPGDTVYILEYTCVAGEAKEETWYLNNYYGCDSIVFYEIRYVGIDTQFMTIYACDSNLVGVEVEQLSGTYCDTIVVRETVWSPFSIGTEIVNSCDPSGPAADTLFFQNTTGCDSLHIRFFQYTQLMANIQTLDERCVGVRDGRIELHQITGGMPPYSFQLNTDPWTGDSIFAQLSAGTYTVTVRDENGCTKAYSQLIVASGETFTVNAGPDREVEPGAMVTLQAESALPVYQVLWSAPDPILCPTCPATQLGPVTTNQTVYLSATNENGCPGEDQFEVTIRSTSFPSVYIPNSFSPNFDGINDLFTIYGNEDVVRVRVLAIYDRWGNHIYYREDIPINDPAVGWDGTYRGRMMDPAVFVYTAEVEFADGSTRLYKGDVTLVR